MSTPTSEPLTLDEVAERLGVHYMTAYRYVRLGLLEARHEGGRWWVEAAAVDGFAAQPERPSPARTRWRTWQQRLYGRLVAGDVGGAWAVVEATLQAGRAPVDLYVHLLGPVLRRIGDEWAAGALAVEAEHRASAVALRLVGRIGPRGARPGRRRRATVLLGGAPGDPHQLPGLMVADALRWEGFGVVDLGANVPVQSFVDVATTLPDLAAVGVSVSVDQYVPAVADVLVSVHRVAPNARLLAGGPALADEDSARSIGAEGWAGEAGALRDLVVDAP